ncbi:MAG: VCBS repeat-containing protein [Thermoanaerobaculia bacterium]|nr:VCBS repeat-containing protein [Thermoanaerobaculia bacterium]
MVDLTGDGVPEIIVPMNTELVVLDRLGHQLSRASGCAQPAGTYQMILNSSANASPTVADLDGDGDLEVVIAGGATFGIGDISAGALYAWDFPAPFQSTRHPWPQFRHDVRNLGLARPEIFRDGFEEGNTAAWSTVVP